MGCSRRSLSFPWLSYRLADPPAAHASNQQALLERRHATAYDTMVSTEGNSINYCDAVTMSKSKGYVTTDWTKALMQIEGYFPIAATLLGVTHPVVHNYQRGLDILSKSQLSLRWELVSEYGYLLAPALMVHYFQLQMRRWLEVQWDSDNTIPPLDFAQYIWTFKMSKIFHWLPSMSNIPVLKALRKSPVTISVSYTAGPSPAAGPSRSSGGLSSTSHTETPLNRPLY